MREHKTAVWGVLVAGGLWAPMAAPAQAYEPYGWAQNAYIGAGGGKARDREIQNNLTVPGTAVRTSKKHDAWKAFTGFDVNRNFGVELGYVHLGDASAGAFTGETVTAKDKGAYLDALLKVPVTRQFGVFLKGGVNDIRSEISDNFAGSSAAWHTRGTYGAGLSINLSRAVGLRGEWERFEIPNNKTDLVSASLVFNFR